MTTINPTSGLTERSPFPTVFSGSCLMLRTAWGMVCQGAGLTEETMAPTTVDATPVATFSPVVSVCGLTQSGPSSGPSAGPRAVTAGALGSTLAGVSSRAALETGADPADATGGGAGGPAGVGPVKLSPQPPGRSVSVDPSPEVAASWNPLGSVKLSGLLST